MNLKLVSKEYKKKTVVEIGGVRIGGGFTIIAGPCAVESKAQILLVSDFLSKKGIKIMRAPIFKPRTFPHSFQGVGLEGLEWLKEVKKKHKMLIACEVIAKEHIKILS